jgi:3',5'-nucleoside bisphosphate phosphatase
MTMKKFTLSLIFLIVGNFLVAQNLNVVKEPQVFPDQPRREIRMPQLEGYQIIKGDFHLHTVFSDGSVWPTVRVQEAWRDGLDAIAITDHVEYRPKRGFLGGSLNQVHDIALPEAEKYGIILVKSAEITRRMPPGHLNALFLTDIDALDTESWQQSLEEARKQDAFIFWNHPGWQAQQPDTCIWFDEHERLMKQDLIHGIEVYNFDEWYPVALDWCREKNLAFIANSDIHEPVPYMPGYSKYFRPMTLVIARDKTEQAMKEAMFNRQTVAFFAGKLAGPQQWLERMFHASVVVGNPFNIRENGSASITITNVTDIPIILQNEQGRTFKLEALSAAVIPVVNISEARELSFMVTNFFTGTNQNLKVSIKL